jgi:inosine-uridine nucleoside N-ribohydrolase
MFGLLIAGVASGAGYLKSRQFVGNRLRYVDAMQSASAPIIAGTIAALAAAPVTWALPFIGAGTAILFGVGVGAGTRAGVRRIRQGVLPALRD